MAFRFFFLFFVSRVLKKEEEKLEWIRKTRKNAQLFLWLQMFFKENERERKRHIYFCDTYLFLISPIFLVECYYWFLMSACRVLLWNHFRLYLLSPHRPFPIFNPFSSPHQIVFHFRWSTHTHTSRDGAIVCPQFLYCFLYKWFRDGGSFFGGNRQAPFLLDFLVLWYYIILFSSWVFKCVHISHKITHFCMST